MKDSYNLREFRYLLEFAQMDSRSVYNAPKVFMNRRVLRLNEWMGCMDIAPAQQEEHSFRDCVDGYIKSLGTVSKN